jgi:hypothetical protein
MLFHQRKEFGFLSFLGVSGHRKIHKLDVMSFCDRLAIHVVRHDDRNVDR